MSIQTSIQFRNINDPEFIKATSKGGRTLEEWEDDNGPISERPGAEVEGGEDAVEETDEEYGGWIIDLSLIPKETTHIVIYRS